GAIVRQRARGNVRSGCEGAVAIAKQHADVVRTEIASDQVELAVAVDVSGLDGCGIGAHWEDAAGVERSIPVVDQEPDVIVALVGNGNVQVAVPVEVAESDFARKRAGPVIRGRLERAIAIAKEHADESGLTGAYDVRDAV